MGSTYITYIYGPADEPDGRWWCMECVDWVTTCPHQCPRCGVNATRGEPVCPKCKALMRLLIEAEVEDILEQA